MPTMSHEALRQQFEARINSDPRQQFRLDWDEAFSTYDAINTQYAWVGFRAAQAGTSAPLPDDARLLQLLADICRAAARVNGHGATLFGEDGATECRSDPDDMAALNVALNAACEVPDPAPEPQCARDGWNRVIETLRRRLALIVRPLADIKAQGGRQ